MSRTSTLLLAVTALGSAAGLACQHLPDDWQQRDLEGKWAYYKNDSQNSRDPNCAKNWALLLANNKEFELLEWIALFEGWRHPGPHLVKHRAPQMYRAALWNLGGWDSHNQDNARTTLLAEGDHALGWIERSPVAKRGHGKLLAKTLREQGYEPDDPGDQLPAHDPIQLLAPMLDAPKDLVWFGDRLRAEPRQRYVEQVLRSLEGLVILGQDEPMVLTKVLTLMGHPQAEVSVAATKTITRLPTTSVPWERLVAMASDAGEADLRRKATTALSYSHHPAAFFALHEIGADIDHPGNSLALVRLGDLGDAYTLSLLRKLSAAQPERAALQKQISRLEPRLGGDQKLEVGLARQLLDRIVWLRISASRQAIPATNAIKRQLKAQGQSADHLQTILQQAISLPAQPGMEGPVPDRLRRDLVEEILAKASRN